jgi:hypothetical protein
MFWKGSQTGLRNVVHGLIDEISKLRNQISDLRGRVEELEEVQEKPRISGADTYVGTLHGVHLYANGKGLSPQTRIDLGKFFGSIADMGGK